MGQKAHVEHKISEYVNEQLKSEVLSLIQSADYHTAIARIEKTCIIDSKFYGDWMLELYYAQCLVMVGNFERCKKITNRAYDLFSFKSGYKTQKTILIHILILLGEFDKAKDIFEKNYLELGIKDKFTIARAWFFNLQYDEARPLLEELVVTTGFKKLATAKSYLNAMAVYESNPNYLRAQDYCIFRRNGGKLRPGLIISSMPLCVNLNKNTGWLKSVWAPYFKYLISEVKDGLVYAYPWVEAYDSDKPVVRGNSCYGLSSNRQIKEPCVVIPVNNVTSVHGCLSDEDFKKIVPGSDKPLYGFKNKFSGEYVGPAHGALKRANLLE